MPPIKKMKSDSGWADLNIDFTTEIVENKNITKTKSYKQMNKYSNSCDDVLDTVFKKKNLPTNSLASLLEACDPKDSSHLSVSKRKQNELSNWLQEKALPGKPKILVVSGPSGCGKTIALKVIAKENNFEVIEWITPSDSGIYENYTTTKQSDKFLEFLIRTTRYNSILNNDKLSRRRLLLVKDIPNIYFFDKNSFHQLLIDYLELGRDPLVFVCPDSECSSIQYSLFPQDIIDKFDIDVINVSATTALAMKNMIKRVSTILNAKGGHILNVNQHSIDEVLSNSIGDVRSTLLNIIFTSLKVPDNEFKSNCGLRSESLGLLHGIGRVINPKRIHDEKSWKFTHDPDDIASYFQSQPTIFLRFLHENYLNTMENIEQIDYCSDIMSLSDIISTEWRDTNLINVNLSLCIRGAMVFNENPVTQWNPVRKPTSTEFKHQRDLGIAEEYWYKKIIRPKQLEEQKNFNNTIEPVDD